MLLKGLNQEHHGQVFEVTHQLLVGRYRKSDIHLEDALVSRNHARFTLRDDQLYLCDLQSRNGTFVNQELIENEVALNHHDKVRIGRSEFIVLDEERLAGNVFELVDDQHMLLSEPLIKKDLTINAAHITGSFLLNKPQGTRGDLDSNRSQAGSQSPPQWLQVLLLINEEIQTQSDPKQMSLAVSQRLLEVLDADRCIVALFNEDERLELHTVCESTKTALVVPVRLSKTVIQQVIEGRCAIKVNDIHQDEHFKESDSLILSHVRSFLVAPIIISNKVVGLIEVSRLDGTNAFTEVALDLVSIVGSNLGVALKHVEQLKQREDHILELREAKDRLESAQQDLVRSQQLAVLGRMASSINHEIGNLLMPLLEHHTAQIEGYVDDELDLFTPEELAYSCTQIKSLIEDIKHFSKGTDRLPQMSNCDLFEQVQKATRFVQIDRDLFPPSGPNMISLCLECEDHPRVIMDPLQIGRVIINLLRNAAQAMQGQTEPPEIHICVGKADGEAYVEVKDNGPGIPEEVRDKLFEPFISTKGEIGLGLGLDISRKIVSNHGGHISYRLDELRGTIFRIQLQLNPTLKTRHDSLIGKITSLPYLPTVGEEF
jgi:signal transduction histidine kinase